MARDEPSSSGAAEVGRPPAWPRDAAWWRRLALTYAASALAGWLASRVGMPLPWMLGPFFAWAVLSLLGLRPVLVPMGRELGQVAIGVAVGLRFTLPLLLATLSLFPEMVAATLYLIAVTMSAAVVFGWLAKADPITSFFATAAGGVADMASVAKLYGGQVQSVALVHAMRVSLVVATVPMLVFFFSERGQAPMVDAAAGSVLLVPVALGLAYLGALALKRSPIPNPWLVGPIFVGLGLGVSGVFVVAIPPLLIVLAQVALGTWLGAQFKRDQMAALPRVTAAAVAVALYLVAGAALGAIALSWWSGLPYATCFLSLAPAAVTEMVLTAKVMNLDAEVITAFHVMRIAIVASTVLVVFKFYLKLRGVRLES